MAKYDDLLPLGNKPKTRQTHFQFLAIEICKSKNTFNPSFMLNSVLAIVKYKSENTLNS